jgi:hypothetical protein
VGSRKNSTFLRRTKIIDFHFDCCDGAAVTEMAMERNPDGGVSQSRAHATVERPGLVQQLALNLALNRYAVGMQAGDPHAEESVKWNVAQYIANLRSSEFSMAHGSSA